MLSGTRPISAPCDERRGGKDRAEAQEGRGGKQGNAPWERKRNEDDIPMLHAQFVAVARPPPSARRSCENTSDCTTQATFPSPREKAQVKRVMEPIVTNAHGLAP